MNNIKNQFLGFLNTPSLFKELNGLSQIELDTNEIKEFDISILDIANNIPLGKRIERFFEFYIEHSKNYKLIKNNIQIINNKQTLGELDFIIYDKKREKYIHVEHIYKFYLYDDSFPNEIDRFIGPNKNDTFVKKIAKLKDKQLPLLYKNETKKYLDDIDINSMDQKVCFKGNIYVPIDLQGKEIPILNNSCIKGFFIKYEDFKKDKYFKEFEYFLPSKPDWISDSTTNKTWISFEKIIAEIEVLLSFKKSPLVYLKNRKENKTQSFFITWW